MTDLTLAQLRALTALADKGTKKTIAELTADTGLTERGTRGVAHALRDRGLIESASVNPGLWSITEDGRKVLDSGANRRWRESK